MTYSCLLLMNGKNLILIMVTKILIINGIGDKHSHRHRMMVIYPLGGERYGIS